MTLVLLLRYLYQKRYSYIIALFVYIAALSCGICHAADFFKCNKADIIVITIGKLFLIRFLPILIVLIGGLFFLGSFISLFAECFFAYKIGFVIASQFAFSFWCGIAYLLLCGIPMGIIYTLIMLFSSASAYDCNLSRFVIRKKGLKRPMTNYEIKQYLGKALVSVGVIICALLLENYVFAMGILILWRKE